MKNKHTIAEIKNQLQFPKTLIEIMMEENVNRNNVPIEFFDDATKAINKIVRLLNKLAKWEND